MTLMFFLFVFNRKSQYPAQKIPVNCSRLRSTCRMWAEITRRAASTASSSTSRGESKTLTRSPFHSARLRQMLNWFFSCTFQCLQCQLLCPVAICFNAVFELRVNNRQHLDSRNECFQVGDLFCLTALTGGESPGLLSDSSQEPLSNTLIKQRGFAQSAPFPQ